MAVQLRHAAPTLTTLAFETPDWRGLGRRCLWLVSPMNEEKPMTLIEIIIARLRAAIGRQPAPDLIFAGA